MTLFSKRKRYGTANAFACAGDYNAIFIHSRLVIEIMERGRGYAAR
jgi:hypothetical protein